MIELAFLLYRNQKINHLHENLANPVFKNLFCILTDNDNIVKAFTFCWLRAVNFAGCSGLNAMINI